MQITSSRFEGLKGYGVILYNDGRMTVADSVIADNPTVDGGGIKNTATGTLKVYHTTISASSYINSSPGAIYNEGAAELLDITITNSASYYAGGGILNMGGTLSLIKSTLRENPARYGGGAIDQNGGSMLILGSTIDRNYAPVGAGILSEKGRLVIANSTISNNEGYESEAAIYAAGPVTITNTTISSNIYSGDNVAHLASAVGLRNAYLDHVTITGNTGGSLTSALMAFSPIRIHNSIVASNGNNDCDSYYASITSAGYNLVSNADGCNWIPEEDDQLGTAAAPIDPMLGPLADNGGPTLTNALLEGSPAIDAGDPDGCLPVDQRGVLRPQGAGCDIGAYEYGPLAVSIDIRPGTSDNMINHKGRATTPVAILSTANFDAATRVDRETLTFGRTGDEQSLACRKMKGEPLCEVQDANGDGLLDLVCSFRIPKMDFRCGDPAGVLKGRTVEETPFSGVDLVRVVPCG